MSESQYRRKVGGEALLPTGKKNTKDGVYGYIFWKSSVQGTYMRPDTLATLSPRQQQSFKTRAAKIELTSYCT